VTISVSREHRDASTVRKTIPASSVRRLGTVGPFEYGEYGGSEYQIGRPAGNVIPLRSGELLASERTPDPVATDAQRLVYRRLTPVAVGTFAALAAKAEAKIAAAEAARRPRPVDTLSRHPIFAPSSDQIVNLGRLRGFEPNPVPGDIDVSTSIPTGAVKASPSMLIPGRPAARGPAAILAAVEGQGVRLSLTPSGQLLAEGSGGRMSAELATAIEAARPFLLAALTRVVPRCAMGGHAAGEAPPAWTIVETGILACEQHATGAIR
jgi:hypothetical protein